ncbi:Protein of unknown function [Lactobacillus helveticus CIRM-BIA 951]|uniref:Uncharacterized protein n=1 Tax=Lactobacillus helveticus CIRM-BIA 951 TaxID=1226334 RepID=U6F846_LACHE|nr:Protein of unknown function [Lactobacillus helveticus CIRM-BIA 951]
MVKYGYQVLLRHTAD